MTWEERVNLGQFAYMWCREQEGLSALEAAQRIAASMFPELARDKPAHAIVPFETTGEMIDAGAATMVPGAEDWNGFPTKTWKAMFDAYRFYGDTKAV